jgi:hypothetical protein
MFTDILADNACSVNPKTTTAKPRDPIWRPARTSTRGAIATVHHRGTFWALAIPSYVLDFHFRQVARWRSTSWFSPHQSWLGCASEGAIRDHGLLHDLPHPLLWAATPIISLINVPNACAAWWSDMGGVPCPLFTNHPCLYIITPSPATPSDLPSLHRYGRCSAFTFQPRSAF